MASESVGKVSFDLEFNSKSLDNAVKEESQHIENAFSTSMKKIGGFIAGAFAAKTVIDFGKSAVQTATKIQSAWTGLNSIISGTGNAFSTAQNFINDYTKDGLMSIEETATAYKNLLSRGYNTEQIENTLNALKDSAAFGRQASYDLGEAVVSATEGLKNENSILVDNAGVTKNVAKMWEEWAKAHNTTTQAMTQAQKIEAEYNGILNETKFQTGDASVYTKTFGGQLQMLKMSFTNLQVAVGRVVTPIAQLFIPAINSAVVAVTKLFNGIASVLKVFGLEFPNVVSKSNEGLANFGEEANDVANEAVKSAKRIKNAFASVDEITVVSNSDSNNGSGTSTSNNASSSIDIVPNVASDNAVENAISGTMDKIMKYINPLKSINFDNLINAFNNLKNAISPFGENISKGLEWLYFNVLVPFAEFSIEDIVPAFLNILTNALDVLNIAIEDVKPLFEWFWDYALKPLTNFTGGIIVEVLTDIGDALAWISQNETAITILESLMVTFGIFKIGAGLSTLITTILPSIIGFIASISISLKAGGLLGVIGTLGSTALSTISSILAAIGPVILPILAVSVAVFGVIEAFKHWDEIKEICSKIIDKVVNIVQLGIEKVKEVVNRIIDFVKNNWQGLLLFITNPFLGAFKLLYDNCESFRNTINSMVESIKNFFGGMWSGLKNGATNAWNGIKNTFSNVANFFGDIFGTAWNRVKNIFSTGGKIFDGIKDGIANAFKNIVNGIIKGINKVVSVPFNGINTALKKVRDVSILGAQPFKRLISLINIPQIPMLAQGGYVAQNSPRLAIIGDNTREGEIVAPESKIYEQTLKAIRDSQTNGKQELEITIKLVGDDGIKLIKKINQAQINAGKILLMV